MLKRMVKHNLTGLPIIKKSDGTLAGMVTRTDIFQHPEEDQLAVVMNRDPLVLSPHDTVETAATLMTTKRVTHIPVVEGNKLVGIITPTDLLYEVEKKASNIPVEALALDPCVPIPGGPLRAASHVQGQQGQCAASIGRQWPSCRHPDRPRRVQQEPDQRLCGFDRPGNGRGRGRVVVGWPEEHHEAVVRGIQDRNAGGPCEGHHGPVAHNGF